MASVAPKRRGFSVGIILLASAALGIAAGVMLAVANLPGEAAQFEEDDAVSTAVAKVMPMGQALAQRDPMEPDPASLEGVPPYPQAAPRKLTSQSVVSGMPMNVAWFSTHDSAQQVLAFYEKAFVADDRAVVSHRYSDAIGYVGWVEATHESLHMVSVVRQGDETVVLISRTDPQQFFDKPRQLPNGVLLPPGAEPPQIIELSELSLDRRTIYARAPNLEPAAAKAFFVRELPKLNWSVSEDDDGLVAKKENSTQVIGLAAQGEGTRILITLDARPAPELSR